MSRRKQENPQPRKRLLSPELEQDVLTCGDCQRDFALGDIVKFIQHKVHRCNKENFILYGDDHDFDSDGENESIGVVGTRRPSISAPIAKKNLSEPPRERDRISPRLDRKMDSPKIVEHERVVTPKPSKPIHVDAEANTTNPEFANHHRNSEEGSFIEPNNYVCSTCKHTFNSAWTLLQHVQNIHGMKIYIDSTVSSTPPEPPHIPLEPHPHPFSLLRMPLTERQFSPSLNHSPFARPPSHDFRMELMNEQFHRLNHNLALPPAFEHHPPFERPPFERPRLTLGIEPTLDFYSQRLRQLAGTTSPPTSPTPRKRVTPPFTTHTPQSLSQPTTPQPPHCTPPLNKTPGIPPSKLKSCEFCGKTFRFQSNLIVHRRSHTGEKPFRCHICNHACTQASKLKRHMKTHMNKSPGSTISENTSVESTSSTPDSNLAKHPDMKYNNEEEVSQASLETGDNDDEEDEDELEEDDVEELGSEMAEDLSNRTATSTSSQERHSLLGEVMEKIGLTDIQQYNEAYKQALEENAHAIKVKEERSSSNSSSLITENGLENRRDRGDGLKSSSSHGDIGPSSYDGPFDGKCIKLELGDHTHEMESMYSGLWLPSVAATRDVYVGAASSDHESRTKASTNESALKSPDNHPKPSTSNAGTPGKPKDRRNDTCEFCGKVFRNCSNLTVHRRSHTGEKPYKCELCSYACAQSSKLTRHMKTHGRVGKDVYRCRFCNMPFSVPSTLEKHMRKCVVNQNSKISETDTDSKDTT